MSKNSIGTGANSAELAIPSAALNALDAAVAFHEDEDADMFADARSIAAPVVAAELRRLARLADDRYRPSGVGRSVESSSAYKREGVELVLRDLFARADELDGGA
ncbi:hypothetical protein EV383_4469 [Pseudonocardia sediminis]|uniref:Uncharacterized protein n=1 Tax=Pseudonocardia sediminis TaxID=1397368 RepID=A0A4Q7V238_PSEST|nr:hypothetical protein [Pseudonocardia sediminis]RZT87544.1 hypothetical protein EV383_4469 [Pseudonocardia sediminis]